ncbi:hypothetical protein CEXT_446351 [Caerostris extrusa]|uniref:Uncharacterized protein n=1 Tax=Caerostris extrusa TaxID=172846 RepID=A0AAV4USI9_CAEEX|nr:hypothetical protein CEXT_446351 [Caerostris extrusa]
MNMLAEIFKMEEHTLRSAGDNPLKFSLNLSFLVTWQLRAYGRKVRPDWRYAGLKLGPVVSDSSDKTHPTSRFESGPVSLLAPVYQATDYFNYSN